VSMLSIFVFFRSGFGMRGIGRIAPLLLFACYRVDGLASFFSCANTPTR
jgi:hypothetical protein